MSETKEMSVIERAARALHRTEEPTVGWDDITAPRQRMYHGLARAVLQAIREPTPEMVEAGMDYDERELNIRLGRPPTVEECQAGEWQAMIDAALGEGWATPMSRRSRLSYGDLAGRRENG